MIFQIDHIVFAATAEDRERAASWLESHGFRARPFSLDFPASGASSESWSFGSGGFLEFVVENEPGTGHREWFSSASRVIGLGFASDAFEADTQWQSEADAWQMNEDHELPAGSVLTIEAAGPHLHASPFYVFVMNRRTGNLEFEPDDGPRLTSIRLTGADAEVWRENLERWLSLPATTAGITVGETVMEFVKTADEGICASLIFASDGQHETYTLGAGSIVVGANS